MQRLKNPAHPNCNAWRQFGEVTWFGDKRFINSKLSGQLTLGTRGDDRPDHRAPNSGSLRSMRSLAAKISGHKERKERRERTTPKTSPVNTRDNSRRTHQLIDRRRNRALAANPASEHHGTPKPKRWAAVRVERRVRRVSHELNIQAADGSREPLHAGRYTETSLRSLWQADCYDPGNPKNQRPSRTDRLPHQLRNDWCMGEHGNARSNRWCKLRLSERQHMLNATSPSHSRQLLANLTEPTPAQK